MQCKVDNNLVIIIILAGDANDDGTIIRGKVLERCRSGVEDWEKVYRATWRAECIL
jgi:hypothetical protein